MCNRQVHLEWEKEYRLLLDRHSALRARLAADRHALWNENQHLKRNIERLQQGEKNPGYWLGLAAQNEDLRRKNGRLMKERAALCRLADVDVAIWAEDDDPLYRSIAALRARLDVYEKTLQDTDRLARLFHEAYEQLAPEYGYETRKESAVPWEQVPLNNRQLMVATVGVSLRVALDQVGSDTEDK